MADLRTTVSGVGGKYPSRVPGERFGIQMNTFGFDRLEGITGGDLEEILQEAIYPAFEQAFEDWPVITQASRDTMAVETTEVGPKRARVAIRIGGPDLIADSRNASKKDYAPYVEFNGTSKTPPGTITHAMVMNEEYMKATIRAGVAALLARKLGG